MPEQPWLRCAAGLRTYKTHVDGVVGMTETEWIMASLKRIEDKLDDKISQYDDEIGQLKTDVAVIATKSGLFALAVSAFVSIVSIVVAWFVKRGA